MSSGAVGMLADIPIWDWMWGWWVDRSSWQLVFNGVITGLVYGLIAMGVVLIYRSTRVINLAVGNMGLPAMGLMAIMVVNYNFPYWIALVVALAVGTVGGGLLELAVVRRLFDAPRVIVLVATIGIAQLMQAILFALPAATPESGEGFPVPLGSQWEPLWGVEVEGSDLTILVMVPVLAIGLSVFLNRTVFGQTVQASATNPDLARLQGINPRTVSLFVWTVAGFLAAAAMIMLAGRRGEATGIQNLGPVTMTRALAAAVIGGMVSFRRALIAGVALGLLQTHIVRIHLGDPGLFDFVLFVLVIAAIVLQTRGEGEGKASFAFVSKRRPVPAHLRSIWWVRHFVHLGPVLLLVIGLVVPAVVDLPSRHRIYARIIAFALCALSVTVITGWSGQVSLAQMAFAGFGALLAAAFSRGFHVGVGWGEDWQWFAVTLPEMPFLLAIFVAAVVTAGIAAVVGLGSLRVRGLLLAVSTFAFALAAQVYLFRRDVLDDGEGSSVEFERGKVGWWELATERDYYYFCLAAFVVVLVVVARLRRSGIGRAIIAVRDNEDNASAYSVSPVRMKLMAFALAGGIAGFGGALLGGLVENVPLANQFFTLDDSLNVVSMVVIGGLGTLLGPVIGSTWIVGLPSFWPENQLVPLFTSSIGLLILILYFPAGLVHAGYVARDALVEWVGRRHPAPAPTSTTTPPVTLSERAHYEPEGDVALRATDIDVKFGGIIAVDQVDFEARHGEVVGLIGTNGAGKSTLMNAIGGFVPSAGTVVINGRDVTALPAHKRTRAGLGRTFQAADLFPELTVRETVLVALEARERTGLVSTSLFLPVALRRDRRKRRQAAELIDFLGLGRYADTFINELSTGTRRIVELAGLLALDAHVLCLDEPTAGLAQRETEAFGPLLMSIRRELNATMIVIEHDMGLIMSMSDRVYCLEDGRVIAEGAPEEVRRDPAVIASYLGTDRRAIDRSDLG
jgi:ABC-type branched-subunit amino acid transport system ATPase component/ABC-type branched-subunit amino acid transport system permease subunit